MVKTPAEEPVEEPDDAEVEDPKPTRKRTGPDRRPFEDPN